MRDKDDTAHVFRIYDALPSRKFVARVSAFSQTAAAAALYSEEPSLAEILDDRRELRTLPAGSVGAAYRAFRDTEGLTIGGLAQQAAIAGITYYDDFLGWYGARERDTHDLLHVVSGYGRDALGETCVLLFTNGQAPSPANLLLGYGGGYVLRRNSPVRVPIWRALAEARRHGRGRPAIATLSVRELLRCDLATIRAAMGVAAPVWYGRCHDTWRAHGVEPSTLMRAAR